MEKKKISFIGFGQMAGAILNGIIQNGIVLPEDVGLFDVSPEKLAEQKSFGYRLFETVEQLISESEIVIIAVRPQDFADVLPLVKKEISSDVLLVSIAAGITGKQIQGALDFHAKVVLAMPNAPLIYGKGATGVARMPEVSDEEFEQVKRIFRAAGVVEEVEVQSLNTVIPISGSAPAFVYKMAELITEYAKEQGIEKEKAMRLFAQTLVGSAEMLLESGKSSKELIEMVSTPGGATIEGMKALEENGFDKAVNEACKACVKRADELSKLNN